MYRKITGIDTDEAAPGYKKIIIKPHPGGNLTYANADYETIYGKVSSHWKKENGRLTMHVEIPANTSATIYIPTTSEIIMVNNKILSVVKEVKMIGKEGNYTVVEVGSGKFQFTD